MWRKPILDFGRMRIAKVKVEDAQSFFGYFPNISAGVVMAVRIDGISMNRGQVC